MHKLEICDFTVACWDKFFCGSRNLVTDPCRNIDCDNQLNCDDGPYQARCIGAQYTWISRYDATSASYEDMEFTFSELGANDFSSVLRRLFLVFADNVPTGTPTLSYARKVALGKCRIVVRWQRDVELQHLRVRHPEDRVLALHDADVAA